MRAVLTVERRVSRPVSQPRPIATTASRAATPSPLRSASPRPSRACSARNTRPPTHTASASAVIAPSAYASSRVLVPTLAPCRAAPVSTRPRIGPAQGAHSRPVAMPISSDVHAPPRPAASAASARALRRAPTRWNGASRWSASRGHSSATANSAISSRAIQRPTWLACATHWLPTAARLATTVKVSAMPSSSGSVLRRNGRSARANTNGSTGRMHGLSRVSAPPR